MFSEHEILTFGSQIYTKRSTNTILPHSIIRKSNKFETKYSKTNPRFLPLTRDPTPKEDLFIQF